MRKISIGRQDYAKLIERNCFYVDKTSFITEWWDNEDDITLITRPRRFGKTLNMSMLECFFSIAYKDRKDLFEGLSVWNDNSIHAEQGAWPVINITFANVKKASFTDMKESLFRVLTDAIHEHKYLIDSPRVDQRLKDELSKVKTDMTDSIGRDCLNVLCSALWQHYEKRALIFLDEYDTPIQEAWMGDCYDEMIEFIKSLFNSTFKTNRHLERAVITGITRVSRESIFSDMNNLMVCSVNSSMYATSFGFTEEEVNCALSEFGMDDDHTKTEIKRMYDGFTFGNVSDIYNPWSLTNCFKEKKTDFYWANSSGNGLVGQLFLNSGQDIKAVLEELIRGNTFTTRIDEQLSFNTLMGDQTSIWSLLLATGYLTSIKTEHVYNEYDGFPHMNCELKATNAEVRYIFTKMILGWFDDGNGSYNRFIKSLLKNDLRAMNDYINSVAAATFSYMDVGNNPSEVTQPERFYHGFVLGLLIELRKDYEIKSNRESGYGRYDVMIIPRNIQKDAYIIEFKVQDSNVEKTLEETASNALKQIDDNNYEAELIEKGLDREKIHKYGFAFRGKRVLILK